MALDADIEAIWHGQESPKTSVTTNGDSMEIGLAGGRYKVVLSHGKRVCVSKDASFQIDANTPMWDAVDSILERGK